MSSCATVRLITASERSPKGAPLIVVGKSHALRQHSQSLSVEGATSRFLMLQSQLSDCWRNVIPQTDTIDACNVSGLSAPLASMISLALRFRAETVRSPGPEVGQIFSRL